MGQKGALGMMSKYTKGTKKYVRDVEGTMVENINVSENDFMDNLYEIVDYQCLVVNCHFFQNHLIFKYINILTLCQLIVIGGAK